MASPVLLMPLTTITGNGDQQSVQTHLLGDLATFLRATNPVSFTAATVKIQESPDPIDVPDASATWLDLVTFTALSGAATEKVTVAVPHFSRLRVSVSGWTGTSIDLEVMTEGVQVT